MSRDAARISGKLALVTGAGSGIGRATALAFAAAGARVIAVDLDAERAAKTAADCGGSSAQVDVSDAAGVADLAERVLADHGAPDILVNNAGVGASGRFVDMDIDDWTWIVGINYLGAINFCRAFGPAMVARRSGHVVNVSSGLAYTPRSTESAYVSTKAALLAFSQCLRADWHADGVGVSAICPGVINTDIVKSNTRFLGSRNDAEARGKVVKAFSRGHKPELVADAIIDAVIRDRSVVPVGFEARLGWHLHRLLPTVAVDRFARSGIGGL